MPIECDIRLCAVFIRSRDVLYSRTPSSIPHTVLYGHWQQLYGTVLCYSPFALSISNIVHFKLSVESSVQPQPAQDVLLQG